MYTKHYKNERKRILSNSMSKAKGFYEAPNAGNNRKCLHSVALSPLSNIARSLNGVQSRFRCSVTEHVHFDLLKRLSKQYATFDHG